jgi:hypothetical protein
MTRTQQHIINRLKAGDKLSTLGVGGYATLSGQGHKREKFQSAMIKRMESTGLVVRTATFSKGSKFEVFYVLSDSQLPCCEDCAYAFQDRCKKAPMSGRNFGIFMYCGTVRGTATMCGKTGKWFERKQA